MQDEIKSSLPSIDAILAMLVWKCVWGGVAVKLHSLSAPNWTLNPECTLLFWLINLCHLNLGHFRRKWWCIKPIVLHWMIIIRLHKWIWFIFEHLIHIHSMCTTSGIRQNFFSITIDDTIQKMNQYNKRKTILYLYFLFSLQMELNFFLWQSFLNDLKSIWFLLFSEIFSSFCTIDFKFSYFNCPLSLPNI